MRQPMLAAKFEKGASEADVYRTISTLISQLGVMWASPKVDGIRALNICNEVTRERSLRTRSMRHMPNLITRERFKGVDFDGFDGELIAGPLTDPHSCRKAVSAFMTIAGAPPAHWMCFDWTLEPRLPYRERYKRLTLAVSRLPANSGAYLMPYQEVRSLDDVLAYEAALLSKGFEGVILRDPRARYKYGRAVLSSGGMLKLKRFVEDEGVIIGWEALERNSNELEEDERGFAKRSTSAEGMHTTNLLGALVVRSQSHDATFKIGSGFSAAERAQFWREREMLRGQFVKFRKFPHGALNKPRQAIFVCIRPKEDM